MADRGCRRGQLDLTAYVGRVGHLGEVAPWSSAQAVRPDGLAAFGQSPHPKVDLGAGLQIPGQNRVVPFALRIEEQGGPNPPTSVV